MNADKIHDWCLKTQGALVRLVLGGSFDFNAYRAFKQLSDQALATLVAQDDEVGLPALGYPDNSALGMLLNFRRCACGGTHGGLDRGQRYGAADSRHRKLPAGRHFPLTSDSAPP